MLSRELQKDNVMENIFWGNFANARIVLAANTRPLHSTVTSLGGDVRDSGTTVFVCVDTLVRGDEFVSVFENCNCDLFIK